MTLLTGCRCRDSRAPIATTTFIADAAARKFDPTNTLDIRVAFRREMDSRWAKLRRLAMEGIDRNANLGLVSNATHESALASAPHIAAAPSAGFDNVKAFQTWIDAAMATVVLGETGAWTTAYIRRAADRALKRVTQLTGRMVAPDEARVRTLASLAIVELQGVMEAVSQQAVRVFASGHLARQRPSQVARAISATINSVGTTRGRMVAETMVVKTHAAVTLDAFKNLGIKKVGTTPERLRIVQTAHGKTLKKDSAIEVVDAGKKQRGAQSASTQRRRQKEYERLQALGEVEVITAGDEAVCEECQDISDSGPYPIDEALGLIPAHPQCRCAFVPAQDERFAEVTGSEE